MVDIANWRKDMEIEIDQNQAGYEPKEHPWIEMPTDDTLDDAIRFSLDEIRVG